MLKKNLFALLFALGAFTQTAQALPLGRWTPALENVRPQVSPRLRGNVDFSAIVALNNCSGALIRFNNSLDTDQAVVMTNGHCYEGGFIHNGQAIVDAPSNRRFRLLAPNAKPLAMLTAEKVLYATMTGTDITLYQLHETYGFIAQKFGTQALLLSPNHPVAGRPIAVASGYWKKIYSCSVDRFIFELREGDWIWKDALRYSQPGCNTVGGTSGSPIIDPETHEVVGINNTGNDDGEKCTENNPCEVDQNGNVVVNRGASYGEETFQIYSCLGPHGQIELTKPGCALFKPTFFRH